MSRQKGVGVKTEIVYNGKKYTLNDIPDYIHRKMPKHPDKLTAWINILKKKNEWCNNNKEKISKSNKKIYLANPEKGRAKTREWCKSNPEKKKKMDEKYRKDNKERIAEYMHNYWKNTEIILIIRIE